MLNSAVAEARLDNANEAAFMARIEPLLPMAYRLAYGLLRRAPDAEDAVQDATFNAWRRRSTFRPGGEVRPWFLAIVANQCRQATRTRWWSVVRRAEPEAEDGFPASTTEESLSLRAALARLPVADRTVLVLRYYLDLPFDEVAATLGVSSAAARVRTHRALARLRPQVIVPEEFENG
jgi:RNA polymerase sigma-70 factor (ECF subfamily)